MSTENGQNIGALLKFERRKAGISQSEICGKSGLAQSTVSDLENGGTNFRIDTLQHYLDAMGKRLNLISKDAELYHYNAQVRSVYDGDTCRVDIDLGLGIWIRDEKLRLARINAPEVTGDTRALGIASRDALREYIGGKEIIIETIKDQRGKYGRYLAEIWLPEGDGYVNINDELVANGYAEYHEY